MLWMKTGECGMLGKLGGEKVGFNGMAVVPLVVIEVSVGIPVARCAECC